MRPKVGDFSAEEMAAWYHGWQPLDFVAEHRITAAEPPEEVVAQVGAVVDLICTLARGASVTFVTFDEPAAGSLTLSVSGAGVAEHHQQLAERVPAAAPQSWWDIEEDSLAVEWIWEHPQGSGSPDR